MQTAMDSIYLKSWSVPTQYSTSAGEQVAMTSSLAAQWTCSPSFAHKPQQRQFAKQPNNKEFPFITNMQIVSGDIGWYELANPTSINALDAKNHSAPYYKRS